MTSLSRPIGHREVRASPSRSSPYRGRPARARPGRPGHVRLRSTSCRPPPRATAATNGLIAGRRLGSPKDGVVPPPFASGLHCRGGLCSSLMYRQRETAHRTAPHRTAPQTDTYPKCRSTPQPLWAVQGPIYRGAVRIVDTDRAGRPVVTLADSRAGAACPRADEEADTDAEHPDVFAHRGSGGGWPDAAGLAERGGACVHG
jgi:hypothetical protein